MKRPVIMFAFAACLLAACAAATPAPVPIPTLAPTDIPPTPSPAPPTFTPRPACNDLALFVEDVTVLDDTQLSPGESFVKTWRIKNTGTCTWDSGYVLVFQSGDAMNAPASTPLSLTAPGATIDLSVNLVAPAGDGRFTGIYEIRDPDGRAVPVGLTNSVWVKIIVGSLAQAVSTDTPAAAATVPYSGSPAPTPIAGPPGKNCKIQRNDNYIDQIMSFINRARADAGLKALKLNSALTVSAQGHAADMACHDKISHTGTDGSSIYDRIVAAGYSPSFWDEIIFGGGNPQGAFNWWMNDPPHRDAILNPVPTEFGIGYAFVAGTNYQDFITVDFGKP